MTSFAAIPPPVRILSGIKRIQRGREDLRDDVVSNMIEYFNGRQILGGFKHN